VPVNQLQYNFDNKRRHDDDDDDDDECPYTCSTMKQGNTIVQ